MDFTVPSQSENIRKIEDIIDIQKANGNFHNIRQVAFILPSVQKVSADYVKSAESGLPKKKIDGGRKKKIKKFRTKRRKSPIPDVISWPSDSDITVLRMKLCLTKTDLKQEVGNILPGDGLHQHDSFSMVNLATLIRQPQTPSKHSIVMEEYLLPLTSWEPKSNNKDSTVEKTKPNEYESNNFNVYDDMSSHVDGTASPQESELSIHRTRKSKMARFLRLYFCPCCTCLYKLETMNDQPSAYFSKRKDN